MPRGKSSGKVSTGAATKPPAKKSARSKEVEPTAAQRKKQERQETLRRINKRQARCLEAPSQLDDDGFIIDMSLLPQKRPAYPAYDDSPGKRTKVGHGSKTRKVARSAPWVEDPNLKKPFPPSKPAVGTAPRDQDPITAMGGFMRLPTEIRDEILRYVVLWPADISVFGGWERVYPRSRPRLNLSILYTCRVLRDQGLRILFGENVFSYDLRDPVASHEHTSPVLHMVFGKSVVPMKQHGHLMRHIKVNVFRNRLHLSDCRCKFEDAILKFLPGRGLAHAVNLHTVTLEIPAVSNRYLEWSSKTQKPDDVPICQYLRKGSSISNALLKLRVQWVRVLARDRFDNRWETNVDMRHFVQYEQMKLERNALDDKRGTPDGGNDQSIPGGTAAALDYMEKLWECRAKKAAAGLHNLAWRIEGLAINPDRAVGELELWKPAPPETKGTHYFQGLPSTWREPSTSTCSRRSRTAATYRQQNISPRRKELDKSDTKAGPTTKTKPGHLDIFKAGDTTKEAALLEAQHDAYNTETKPIEKGRLTEEWLENVLDYDVVDIRGSVDSNEPETRSRRLKAQSDEVSYARTDEEI
ncbi:hypothetical protein F5B18DRAFT_646085 [Nemania serpens]|nr:hypothetical protein F5B18DRAFT_646085 [Nemania serpens]